MPWTFVTQGSQITAKRTDLAAFTGTLTYPSEFPAGYDQSLNIDQVFMLDLVYLRLSTSAVAASRRVRVELADSAGVQVFAQASRTSHPASTVVQYYFYPGVSYGTPLVGTWSTESFPPLLAMHPTYVLTVTVGTGQAGDVVNQVMVQGHVMNPR